MLTTMMVENESISQSIQREGEKRRKKMGMDGDRKKAFLEIPVMLFLFGSAVHDETTITFKFKGGGREFSSRNHGNTG